MAIARMTRPGWIILAGALAGVGAWLGGMTGMNVGSTRLKQFEDAIEGGRRAAYPGFPLIPVIADRARGQSQLTYIKKRPATSR